MINVEKIKKLKKICTAKKFYYGDNPPLSKSLNIKESIADFNLSKFNPVMFILMLPIFISSFLIITTSVFTVRTLARITIIQIMLRLDRLSYMEIKSIFKSLSNITKQIYCMGRKINSLAYKFLFFPVWNFFYQKNSHLLYDQPDCFFLTAPHVEKNYLSLIFVFVFNYTIKRSY